MDKVMELLLIDVTKFYSWWVGVANMSCWLQNSSVDWSKPQQYQLSEQTYYAGTHGQRVHLDKFCWSKGRFLREMNLETASQSFR